MLLKANCIKDTQCENCDFFSECIVQRTMYSKLEKVPEFMQSNDSVGYVIECENYQEYFDEGENWGFNLLLFGKTLCYFNLYLQALFMLGQEGLGKHKATFQIISVTNSMKEMILDQYNNVYMEGYRIKQVHNYVEYRKKQITKNGFGGRIKIQSPLSLKYKGKELNKLNMEAILLACARRLYMLDCFENLDAEKYRIDFDKIPDIYGQKVRLVSVPRYSTRHESKMTLKGIEGTGQVDHLTDEQLFLLLAGELVHIGKHTSFGFGRYRLM